MPLQLNDANESVRLWRGTMNARFGGLYTRLNGALPTDTNVFGPRAVLWQKEYEKRTGQPQDGVVSDADLIALHIAVPPVIEPDVVVISVGGAGSQWNTGYQYDMGENIQPGVPPERRSFWHQPIGFDTRPVPMNRGVKTGIDAIITELDKRRGARGLNCTVLKHGGISYSMGAIAYRTVLDRILWGDLGRFKSTFIGDVTLGNPRRQMNHTFPGCSWSSGEGIVTPTDHDLPVECWDMAADRNMDGAGGDDLYTKMADDESDQTTRNMRAVWDIINKGNPLNLAAAVLMLLAHPSFQGGYDAAVAAIKALNFFVVQGTGPHVRYGTTYPIQGDSRDCWELGRQHMADLVARRTPIFPAVRAA